MPPVRKAEHGLADPHGARAKRSPACVRRPRPAIQASAGGEAWLVEASAHAGTRRRQLGRSSTVPGTLWGTGSSARSSSATSMTSAGPIARSVVAATMARSTSVSGSPASRRAPACASSALRASSRSSRSVVSWASVMRPRSRRSSMSPPRHQPANVGVSCVLRLATDSRGDESGTSPIRDGKNHCPTCSRNMPWRAIAGRTWSGTVPRSSPTSAHFARVDSSVRIARISSDG